jgi:hypothetical protein
VLSPDDVRSPLAARPYDLRHAAVSTWLNAGVPSTQVAEWAGHSVGVLHQIYAKVIVGQEDAARKRIAAAGGEARCVELGHVLGTDIRQTPVSAGYNRTTQDRPLTGLVRVRE